MDWKKFVLGNTTSYTNNKEKYEPINDLESLDRFVENQNSNNQVAKDYHLHKDILIHKSSNKKYINTAEFDHYINKYSSPNKPVMFLDILTQVKYELTMLTTWTPIGNGLFIIDSENIHFISLSKKMIIEVIPINKVTAVEDKLNILTVYIGARKLTFKSTGKTVKQIRKHIQNIKML